MTFNDPVTVNLQGKIVPLREAKISLFDRGFLFGHSLFETMLVKNFKVVNWDLHYQRLLNGAQKINIPLFSRNEIEEYIKETINKHVEIYKDTESKISLRLIVTGGISLNLYEEIENLEPQIYLICRNILPFSNEKRQHGFKLKTFLDERSKSFVTVKSSNYLFNYLTLNQAKKDGFDETLYYNLNENFTESSTSNFVWIQNNIWYSCPSEENCLSGTTLLQLKETLEKNNVLFQWKSLPKNKLNSQIQCCLVSSVRGLVPVCQIDDVTLETEPFFTRWKFMIQEFLN